jgi:hypothetical protein
MKYGTTIHIKDQSSLYYGFYFYFEMNIEREQRYLKKINALDDWKEYCLESKYPDLHTINLLYLRPIRNSECCNTTVSSMTITNSIRTLVSYDYIEINDIRYLSAMNALV